MKTETGIPARLLAPCGMNCALCMAYQRGKNRCPGCASASDHKPKHCQVCRIKTCAERREGSGFCFDCAKYPCLRLRQLDKRYRAKYGMSMIENLGRIDEKGPERFMEMEKARWACRGCGAMVCVHTGMCHSCGKEYTGKPG